MIVAALLLLAQTALSSDYNRGLALLQSGRLKEALAALETAVKLAPEHAATLRALGRVHAAMGNFDLAEPRFRRACQLDLKDADACYYLGRSRYVLNQFEGSLAALSLSLKTGVKAGRVYQAMGQAHEALGNAVEAEGSFQKAIELGWPEARTIYGVFLFRQGRLADAQRSFAEAVKAQPASAQAQLELGRTFLQQGEPQRALPYLQRAVELDASSAPAHLLLGKAYQRLGRMAEADRHLAQGSRTAQ